MIYFDPNVCPQTHEEAFRLQEQTVYLHGHIRLIKQVLDVLEEQYFCTHANRMRKDPHAKDMLALAYESIQKQIETATTLVDDCIEYLGMLRGEETVYSRQTDETLACRDKIRTLLKEETV